MLLATTAMAEGAADIAAPTTGFTYYNRVGVAIGNFDAAMTGCLSDVRNIAPLAFHIYGPVGNSIVDTLGGIFDRNMPQSALENCMLVRGWRVVRVEEAEGAALAKLPKADLRGKLQEWVGSENPHGAVVKEFKNDAALGSTRRFHARATPKKGDLSLLGFQATSDVEKSLSSSARWAEVRKNNARMFAAKSMAAAGSDQAPAELATLIFHLKGNSADNGQSISFRRVDTNGELALGSKDQPNALEVGRNGGTAFARKASPEGSWYSFRVPPGIWRLESVNTSTLVTNFCLGSPAFEAKAGEVLFGGMLDLGAESMEPDMNLAEAEQWLGENEALSKTIRPALYLNGTVSQCDGIAVYALEFKDAPFIDGYKWGSKAQMAH